MTGKHAELLFLTETCRVIIFDRKRGWYDFLNANIRISFSDAIDALNQVSTDGLPYEKYNYEDIHFETRYGSKKTTAWTIKLNPAAIDEFMREDSESHEFSESWDLGENTTTFKKLIGGQLKTV